MSRGRPPSERTVRSRKAEEVLKQLERGELIHKKDVAQADSTFSMDVLLNGLEAKFKDMMEARANSVLSNLKTLVDTSTKEIKEHERRVITVKTPTKVTTIDSLVHNKLEDLLQLIGQRMPTLIVGPAGSGKTFLNTPLHEI